MFNTFINKVIIHEKDLLEILHKSINNRSSSLITYFNQHCFNIYSMNEIYKSLLNKKFIVYADGMGIQLVLKFILGKKYKKFNATDLNKKIIEMLLLNKIRFFIIGGMFNQNELKQKFGLNSCFVGYNSGFFEEYDINKISNRIQNLNPDVIIIGMGVPKQEFVAVKLSNILPNKTYICVGNFLEFYFGNQKRVPRILRNKGVEWIYRLMIEPKRLMRRYLLGIPIFLYRSMRFWFKYYFYKE